MRSVGLVLKTLQNFFGARI